MPGKASPDCGEGTRRRRTHKKSRRGCGNCKLRRIKCDEGHPRCQKCREYGVECSYGAKASGMQFAGESSFSLHGAAVACDTITTLSSSDSDSSPTCEMPIPQAPKQSLYLLSFFNNDWTNMPSNSPLDGLLNARVGTKDLGLLAKFRERTVLSIGTKQASQVYQKEIFNLACAHPYLTHIVSTLTLLHERFLSGKLSVDETTALHWYQGTSMFKDALSRPIKSESKDALWTSAALLGCIAFAGIDARTPEDAWPLRPSSPSDLDWLKMSDGKKAVFKIADPMRPGSIFSKCKIDHSWMYRPIDYSNISLIGLARDYTDLFDLGPNSTGENNPYHEAAMSQARLLGLGCTQETLIEFMSFIGHINPGLKALLLQKDGRAMLLLACWYAQMYKYQWWIQRRGLLEGRAICMYLDRYHGDDQMIQRLLEWPKREFGLLVADTRSQSAETWCASSSTVLCVV